MSSWSRQALNRVISEMQVLQDGRLLSRDVLESCLLTLASIPGRVFAFITVRQTTRCSPNRYKSENSAWDRGYSDFRVGV